MGTAGRVAVVAVVLAGLLGAGPRRKPTPATPRHDPAAVRADPPVPGEVSVPLGGTADAVVPGGGGRFLVFHLTAGDDLVEVDTDAGQVTHLYPGAGDVRFAAGRDKLVVVDNGQHVVQRFDLATGKRERSVLLTDDRPVAGLAMGSDSAGPLGLWFAGDDDAKPGGGMQFWDVPSMKRLAVAGQVDHPRGTDTHAWPSADGRTFCLWGWTSGPFDLLRLSDVTATSARCRLTQTKDGTGMNRAWAMPTADGSELVQFDAAVYDDASQHEPIASPPGPLIGAALLPTADPRWLVAVRRLEGERGAPNSSLAILTAHDRRVVLNVDRVPAIAGGQITTDIGRLGANPRVYYRPDAKRLVMVPDGDDRVIVRPLDVPAAVARTGADYLFVTSKPPATVVAKETLNYQIETLTSAKAVTFKLEEGPAGMAVSAAGLVTWPASMTAAPDVNENPDGVRAAVVVSVTDAAGGQEVTHGFGVRVLPALPPPGGVVAADATGAFDLPASAAALVGGKLRYQSLGYVDQWDSTADAVTWKVNPARPGWYTVEAVYGSGYGMGHYDVSIGRQVLTAAVVRIDGNPINWRPFPVGGLLLPAGEATVTLRGVDFVNGMMYLRAVRLTPTTAAGAAAAVAAATPKPPPEGPRPFPRRPGTTVRPPVVVPPGPKDHDLVVIGEKLAARIAEDLNQDAALDTAASVSVTAAVTRATRTGPAGRGPTAAGQLTVVVTQVIHPLTAGDVVTVKSDVDALVRKVDGRWTCDAATMRITSATNGRGPVGEATHRARNVTRAIKATLDDVQGDDPPPGQPRPRRPAEDRVSLQKV